jgi:FkbM family methyltransferase
MRFALVGCAWVLFLAEGGPVKKESTHAELRASASSAAPTNRLRATPGKSLAKPLLPNSTANLNSVGTSSKAGPACQCDLGQPTWVPCARTVPKCIFIDLGAADGNTLQAFVSNQYGPVHQCPSGGQWEATLVEANPRFNAPLQNMEAVYPGAVHAKASHAAYMCEAQATFYLDTQNHDQNYWGSSMSANHVDTQKSGHQAVTVPTVNILRLLYETTIPGDWVILKMDIEGAEWDVLPCLAQASVAGLVDRLLVEVHPQSWGNVGTTQEGLDTAMRTLQQKGVDIPQSYHSKTL